jgi:hypothetical protein
MKIRYLIEQLQTMAVREIGFCVGTYWRSVTGSRVPEGMVSARCRLAYVLFTGFAPAYRFHDLLTRAEADCLPRRHIRLVQITHAGRTIIGVAVIAVVSPDSANPEGFKPAPPHRTQPGYQRFSRPSQPSARWDDRERSDGLATERFDRDAAETPYDCADRDDLGLEILLDQLEREYDDKLWWYGAPGRRTKYPPALGSVQELFAYARRKELDLEEIARRNRERQTDQWLNEQYRRDRQRQHDLDADQAEIAVALATPRRGRTHTDDEAWLAETQTFTARRRRRLYRALDRQPRQSQAA